MLQSANHICKITVSSNMARRTEFSEGTAGLISSGKDTRKSSLVEMRVWLQKTCDYGKKRLFGIFTMSWASSYIQLSMTLRSKRNRPPFFMKGICLWLDHEYGVNRKAYVFAQFLNVHVTSIRRLVVHVGLLHVTLSISETLA